MTNKNNIEVNALEKYGLLMSYLQYENSIYWTRSNFYLLACTALFGIASSSIPSPSLNFSFHKIIAFFIISGAGLYLTFLWHQSVKSGEYWIEHWHVILKNLEPDAFSKIHVLRDFELPGKKKVSARQIQKRTLFLFYWLWVLLLIYSIIVACQHALLI